MDEYGSLSRTTWDATIVWFSFRNVGARRCIISELRRHLGEVFRPLARQKESKVEEGHLMPDHVHMLLSIPPKYAGVAGAMVGVGDRDGASGRGRRGSERRQRRRVTVTSRVDGRTILTFVRSNRGR